MEPQRKFPPTPEQQAARDAFATGQSLKLTAGAGTGKTTTLQMLAEDARNRRGLYAAFNTAIAAEAKGKFPRNVDVLTTHSMAQLYRHCKSCLNWHGTLPPHSGLCAESAVTRNCQAKKRIL